LTVHATRRARTLLAFLFLATGCRALDPFEHLPEESLPEAGAVVSQHRLATAASAAFPPSCRMRNPTSVARRC